MSLFEASLRGGRDSGETRKQELMNEIERKRKSMLVCLPNREGGTVDAARDSTGECTRKRQTV